MDPVQVTDVNVTVSIAHTYVSDLTLVLRSPNGTDVELSSGNGGSGDDYSNTTFDQDADEPITAGSPPFTGTFIPEGDLTDFNGEDAVGSWTLIVTDAFFLDGGAINTFRLEVCGIRDPFDYDADGVTNDLDNCVFTANSDQADADNDGIGDICDDDDDNDGILDTSDNCQFIANADQADMDMDGIGDPCDTDVDGDGRSNDFDNCPDTYNPDQADLDNDGIGDLCDEVLASDVLSPNGDGINDTWMIVNIERYPNAKVNVYNRWGNEVFSAVGYTNDWRGTNGTGGNQLPAGSYFYQIDQYGNGEVIVTGWIYITF
jgi:gliding motility-associated-like protein